MARWMVLMLVLASSCTTTKGGGRVDQADAVRAALATEACAEFARAFASHRETAAFATLSQDEREGYLLRHAACLLSDGDAAAAQLAVVSTTSPGTEPLRMQLRARLAAARHDHAELASWIVQASRAGQPCADLLTRAPETRAQLGEQRVFELAAWCWFSDTHLNHEVPAFDDYVQTLAELRDAPLVDARAAAADPQGTVGRTVAWRGHIVGASIDRKANRTLIELEHVEVQTQRIGARTVVTGHREEVRFGGWYLVPVTREVESFTEVYQPTGVHFFLVVPRVAEDLVAQQNLLVVGSVLDQAEWSGPEVKSVAYRPAKAKRFEAAGPLVRPAYVQPVSPKQWEN